MTAAPGSRILSRDVDQGRLLRLQQPLVDLLVVGVHSGGIRTELLDPIEVDNDPERAEDQAYVDEIYAEVESVIQAGMDRLAAERTLPVLG